MADVIAGVAERPSGVDLSNPILTAPILRTLLRLAAPNTAATTAATLVAIAETVYVGSLGTAQLAAIALVFPFVSLMGMMSGGAMGGGISSAVARALGAGDIERASVLAMHAVIIGIGGGIVFTAMMLGLGPILYAGLGGQGVVLDEALAFSNVVFSGSMTLWMANTLASVLRGSGNMRVPSATLLTAALAQVVIGGTLGLGLFGFPALGMAGVACGHLLAFVGAALVLGWYLLSGRSRVKLSVSGFGLQRRMFADILKVGGWACLNPLQSVATVLIFARLLAPYGPVMLAGYGVGARLEFILAPVAASIGMASVPIVGMNIGAGLVERARQAAWAAGGFTGLAVGLVGVILAIWPDLWLLNFTDDSEVIEIGRSYLRFAGCGFGFLAGGTSLYFASQGSGKILSAVFAQTARLVMVAVGGWMLVTFSAPGWTLFALAAASMVFYGCLTALSVSKADWKEKSA